MDGNKPSKIIIFAILLIIAATTIYPLAFIGLNSFKQRVEYYTNQYGIPHSFYLDNFVSLFQNQNILSSLFNSIFVTVVSVISTVFIASLASFPLAKLNFKGKKAIFLSIISMMMIPGQVLLIPIYLIFSKMGLINHFLSVILVYTVISLPFGIFLLTSNFRGIPNEIIESAKMDGCSPMRTFLSIILPMGKPAVMTLSVLSFLSIWNELLLGMMLLPDESKRLLTVAVATIVGKYVTNQPLLMSGLFIGSLPSIIVFAVFSRYLVKGISVGVGK